MNRSFDWYHWLCSMNQKRNSPNFQKMFLSVFHFVTRIQLSAKLEVWFSPSKSHLINLHLKREHRLKNFWFQCVQPSLDAPKGPKLFLILTQLEIQFQFCSQLQALIFPRILQPQAIDFQRWLDWKIITLIFASEYRWSDKSESASNIDTKLLSNPFESVTTGWVSSIKISTKRFTHEHLWKRIGLKHGYYLSLHRTPDVPKTLEGTIEIDSSCYLDPLFSKTAGSNSSIRVAIKKLTNVIDLCKLFFDCRIKILIVQNFRKNAFNLHTQT